MPIVDRLLSAWENGQISSAIAVMELLLITGDAGEAVRLLRRHGAEAGAPNRFEELLQLVENHPHGCARAIRIARRFEEHAGSATTLTERVALTSRRFDESVADCEEASVALYSLGNPEMLRDATDEVVRMMRRWGLVAGGKRYLQIGCGIGRFEIALSPHVGSAVGIDIAPKMIEVARRRAAGLSNVRFAHSNGLDLSLFEDGAFDVVYAVDSMPYIVDAGSELVEAHFREAARVLVPNGEFVIFAFSYRPDPEADRRDVARLAREHGFRVLLNGTSPFDLWNGRVFRMARAA